VSTKPGEDSAHKRAPLTPSVRSQQPMRSSHRSLASVVGCCLLLTGCYRLATNISQAEVAQPGVALVLASVTQTSDGGPTPFNDRAMFYFSNKDGGHRFRLESAEIYRPVLGPPNYAKADAGLEAVHGKLYAVHVPSGTYQLDHFKVEWPSQQEIRLAAPVEIDVVEGEVVYIGNLDAAFCIRHAYANQLGIAGVKLSVNDQSSRDIPLLRARFSSLRHVKIEKRMIDNSSLQQQTARLASRCMCRKNC